MSVEVCNVYARYMFSLLDSQTWTIGCDHKELAMVNFNLSEQRCYVTLMTDEADIGFEISAGGVRKLFQTAVDQVAPQEPPDAL